MPEPSEFESNATEEGQHSALPDNVDSEHPSIAVKNGKGPSKRKPDRPVPHCTYRDALTFAKEIFAFNSGNPVVRTSLLEHLGKGINSSQTRDLITGTGKYGLIVGNHSAEYLSLTNDALLVVDDSTPAQVRTEKNVKLGIESVEILHKLYKTYEDRQLPTQIAIKDYLSSLGVPPEWIDATVDTFIDNTKYIGLLKVVSGAERLISLAHLTDDVRRESATRSQSAAPPASHSNIRSRTATSNTTSFDHVCFYVTPIGAEGSEARQHSDLFLNHLVAPALAEFGLQLVRADGISESGIITRQIIEHIVRSKLVVADLSYHNPNVFYELALRHACRLPTVQIIRKADPIPFDVNQVRTVEIDDSSIYSLIPQLETYRSEIANQVRKALADEAESDNPVSVYFPNLHLSLNS